MPPENSTRPPDVATVRVLRQDLALQIARFVERSGKTQLAAARSLDVPQPTISKIANARVTDLSLELLIRIAVRARLPLVIQTGNDPSEAGVFVSGMALRERAPRSRLAEHARHELLANARELTPEERLDAQLRHSALLAELHRAGRNSRREAAIPRRKRPHR
jgi:predicted XRE-type DNA-binding protein